MRDMDRRTFIKVAAAGAAMAAATGNAAEPAPVPASRTLGRTGMKLNVIGIGALKTTDPAIFQAAFDRGVNYVDTARVYMEGRSEKIVGEALKGYRDKIYLATKTFPGSKDQMQTAIQESFDNLKVEYVDLLQLHHIEAKDGVYNKDSREVFAEVKKQGRARFLGVSTHKNEAEVINAVVDDPEKFYDMVLVSYNFKSKPEVKQAIARAAQAGIGIVAMKTQAGGYNSKEFGDIKPHQAALRWVLDDKNVTAAIPGMVNLTHVIENTAVMGMPQLTRADMDVLRRYETAIAPYYCHRCDACRETCPMRVAISEVNRSLMYAEGGYDDLRLARETYDAIPTASSAAACGDCAGCTAVCPNGLDIGERMERAREILA